MRPQHLLRLLAILTLMLAPLALLPGSPAMASPHALATALALGHCDEGGKTSQGHPRPHVHCSVTAIGLPATGGEITAQALSASSPMAILPVAHLSGLKADASTPPPRLS